MDPCLPGGPVGAQSFDDKGHGLGDDPDVADKEYQDGQGHQNQGNQAPIKGAEQAGCEQ